ncbi:MAG: glutathione S-transferase family protein [Tsuneonella sp.]
MPIDPNATIEITAFEWVPDFARGFVRDLRPRWACEEAGLAYRERLISAVERPAWYFAEQPWGQVPAMRDGAIHLFESGATLLHLGEKSAALLPASGQPRADVISWLFAAFNSVEPALFEFTNVNLFAREEEWAKLRRPSLEEFIGRRLAPLEKRLAQQDWLTGAFSIADIAMVTVLRAIEDSSVLSAHPAVAGYIARGMARPAFKRAMADQLAVFDAHPQPQMQGA